MGKGGGRGMVVVECGLRLGAVMALVLAACLVGLDSQTKFVLFLHKTVTYKNLNSLIALVYVDIAAAAYNLTRLVVTLLMMSRRSSRSPSPEINQLMKSPVINWGCYIFDQVGVYVTFAVTLGALQHCTLVMTGEKEMQWLKWCNKFTRFCVQIGGGLFCSFLACILMALVSFISAFDLFRLYSPTPFLRLKKKMIIPSAATAAL